MTAPVVVKLGGDALSSPERIVAQAKRLQVWARKGPLVAVASARRGVTDHLVSLVDQVRTAAGPEPRADEWFGAAEADRAIAAGEVVAASLLALALDRLGTRAISLDGREAGIAADGPAGSGSITTIRSGRIESLLAQDIVPIVTGFQGWRKNRLITLGRGGSDTSAVALGLALGAGRVVFVKDAAGLRTADPKLVADTRPIPLASHRFLSALARAGSKVVHPAAAVAAEHHRLPLEFWTLDGGAAESEVRPGALTAGGARAVAVRAGVDSDHHHVTVVGLTRAEWEEQRLRFQGELLELGLVDPPWSLSPDGYAVRVPRALSVIAAGVVHKVVLATPDPSRALGEIFGTP